MAKMSAIMTTYRHIDGTEHHAVQLTWRQVAEILGHEHDGSAENDARLVEHLRSIGAPVWIEDAEGWTDEHVWGLIGPPKRVSYEVIEDNGGGLHLAVFDGGDVIFYGYGYEFDHLALRENLQALRRGEDPREDGWEAPADVDAPQRWYNELHVGESNGGVVIADNERIYYDRLGAEGTRFFIPRWDELELFDSDGNTLTTPENIREALQEFRRDGGMLGVFFHFLGFPHEDPEDASTWGPESPDHVDWTGFPS